MTYAILALFLALWATGIISSYTVAGFIPVILSALFLIALIRFITWKPRQLA